MIASRSARRLSATLRSLWRDRRGTAITEFGFVAAPFLVLTLGSYHVAYTIYAQTVFDGAVERAARISSLEGGKPTDADKMVLAAIDHVVPRVKIKSTRTSYFDFADINRAEQFTDSNKNKTCDPGEPYLDENGSGKWDKDIGVTGNGGAGDVVIYSVTATYPALIRIPFVPSSWTDRTMTASAVKKNQPFGNQKKYATTTGTCTAT